MECKHLQLTQTQIKFGAEGGLKFSGYASVFNGVDSYGDTVAVGAYKRTLENRDRPVALRWNHYGPVIGKYVDIYEDEIGLRVEGELTKGHSVAEDAAALMRHGAISGLSIGYIVKDSDSNHPHAGRLLKDIELVEISVVEEPADNEARVDSVKSALAECATLKEIEAVLRKQCGLSRQEATATVSAVKHAVTRSESERETLSILNSFKIEV